MNLVKELYIIRHGETDFNRNGIVQGSGVNSSLNDTGKLQAQLFYEQFKDVPFDKVYVSKLKRTKESVQGFLDAGLPYEELEGLNEISWGDREGNPFTEEENKYYYDILDQWKEGKVDLPVAGGESPVQVAARQKLAMEHIMDQEGEKKVLVCMHGRAMRILLAQLLNYPLSSMDVFLHQNLGLYKLKATKKQYQLVAYNQRSF